MNRTTHRPHRDRLARLLQYVLCLGVLVFGPIVYVPAEEPDTPCQAERAADKQAANDPAWQKLFDGKKLGKWKVIDQFDFTRHGKVHVADGAIVMEKGKPATGVKWSGPLIKTDYELTFEGKRIEGDDFFCSITFPVDEAALTLVVGGWSGEIVGLSSIDDEPAIENETCQYVEFEQNRWYRVRLRVTRAWVEVWIDDEKLIDFSSKHRKLSIYWEMEPKLPLGIATWNTTGAVRNVRVRRLQPDENHGDRATNPAKSEVP